MKHLKILFPTLLAIILVFSGCTAEKPQKTAELNIVSTVFSGWDLARQIGGEMAEVDMLLPPGSEAHSFEPTPKDIIDIQNADLFIYVGGESDAWIEEILSSLKTPVQTLKMMESVDPLAEEAVDGTKKQNEDEYDEHVWTSPENAIKISESIKSALCEIDEKNKAVYTKNQNTLKDELTELDREFTDFFATVKNKTIVFGDRFPMRYFTEAYGLQYLAAFPGCANESEPSAKILASLIDRVKEEKIEAVFYTEFSNQKVANSIAEATGAKTALFHSCHNVTRAEMDRGESYISLMRQNLSVLKGAMK